MFSVSEPPRKLRFLFHLREPLRKFRFLFHLRLAQREKNLQKNCCCAGCQRKAKNQRHNKYKYASLFFIVPSFLPVSLHVRSNIPASSRLPVLRHFRKIHDRLPVRPPAGQIHKPLPLFPNRKGAQYCRHLHESAEHLYHKRNRLINIIVQKSFCIGTSHRHPHQVIGIRNIFHALKLFFYVIHQHKGGYKRIAPLISSLFAAAVTADTAPP